MPSLRCVFSRRRHQLGDTIRLGADQDGNVRVHSRVRLTWEEAVVCGSACRLAHGLLLVISSGLCPVCGPRSWQLHGR